MVWQGLIHRYRPWMAISQDAEPVTLYEGNTPLIRAPKLAEWVGGGVDLHVKFEGMNPTGSFKDRGMTAALTQARHDGAQAVICASTGNTSASAAAYAARAGLKCFVLVPDGKVALGKLAGTLAYGATIVAVRGSFDRALELVQQIAASSPIALVNNINPARLEGQKTGAWETCFQLGRVPDWFSLPVGNAGNITAYWMGFSAGADGPCKEMGAARPKLLGTQAAGAAPLVLGHRVEHPETKATAIRIGNPVRADQAKAALAESGGRVLAATDDEIFAAYRAVASLEGVFCEPSSAASIAGLKKAAEDRPYEFEGRTVVCLLTGNGLKDPDSVFEAAPQVVTVEPDYDHVMQVLLP